VRKNDSRTCFDFLLHGGRVVHYGRWFLESSTYLLFMRNITVWLWLPSEAFYF